MSIPNWIEETFGKHRRKPPILIAVGLSFAVVLIAYVAVWMLSGRSFSFWEKLVDWPLNIVGLLITLGVVWFVDSVKSDTEAIQDSLRTRLNSFDDIRDEALKMLEWVTPDSDAELSDTSFRMTSATPVFGLEFEDGTSDKWLKTLERRSKANADTQLLCYNWHALDGVEASPLGRFAQALPAGAEPKNWRSAFVRAWQQYDELLPNRGANNRFTIRLVDEPEFGIVLARRANFDTRAIIYLSNSASVAKKKEAVAFKTTDRNWIELLERTFEELASAPPLSFKRESAIVKRDHELYKAFADQGNRDTTQEVVYNNNAKTIEVEVFPGVFPVKPSLDTAAMLDAIEKLTPALAVLVQRNEVTRNDGRAIRSVHGVDVGAGTGVLAIALADHAHHVSATENYRPACANTLYNLRRHAFLKPDCAALQNYREDALPERDRYRPEAAVLDGTVVNCDLAKGVYRRADDEMLLFCFNYPAYPSPSNVFNTGGSRAGETIVREFLADIKKRFEACDLILLPGTGISDKINTVGANISGVARDMGFEHRSVYSAPKQTYEDYTVSVEIHLLFRREAEALVKKLFREMSNPAHLAAATATAN